MAYAGYLLKVGGTTLPLTYMQVESYKVTPNQRLETSAERNVNGVLMRATIAHTPSKIEFNTVHLREAELRSFMALLTGAYTSARERKLTLEFFCPDTGLYQTGAVYVPDIDFTIYSAANGDLLYAPFRVAFIEY